MTSSLLLGYAAILAAPGRPGRFGALLDRWIEATYSWDHKDWTIAVFALYVVAMTFGILVWRLFG